VGLGGFPPTPHPPNPNPQSPIPILIIFKNNQKLKLLKNKK